MATSIPLNAASDPIASEPGSGLIRIPAWSQYDWLWHGFSTRAGGVSSAYLPVPRGSSSGESNFGFTAHDTPNNVRENRHRFVEAITGSRETPLRTVRQIHSCTTVSATESTPDTAPEADGILTQQPGILVGVLTADCIPVLVADPVTRTVAAFHAGWRGTVDGIVELGIARMKREAGSDAKNLIAAIGPGIGPCCYVVGEELHARFAANYSYSDELFTAPAGQLRVNLWEANRRQLLSAGVPDAAIWSVGLCTSCNPGLFFSHRASAGHAGRMIAAIGVH